MTLALYVEASREARGPNAMVYGEWQGGGGRETNVAESVLTRMEVLARL